MSAMSSSSSWDELSSHFARLLELPAAERPAWLVGLARERPELARELAAMLAAEDDSQALEVEAAFADTLSDTTDVREADLWLDRLRAAMPGEQIGPYRLLELVARGGMGEVFLAERVDGAFEQKVAIKLMRPGLDTVDLVSRFALERDLLARLTHPSVVPLLDGGTTAEGRPYLVLQFVDGKPITQHCAERELDRRARVRLFYRLCRAVAYAHSHLVVHRDLKPSNILVTPEGEVRLLDFGIAKLLSGERPRGEVTSAELVPMTPERAAPEQKRLEPITTATDVWALGLLLAELLTGALPAGAEEGQPRLQGLASTLADRDLAAILTHALRTEPERRYATAGELADDVERWLSREPVKARPDSFGYRLNRFVARHRGAVTVGTAALVALVLLASLSAWQSWRMAKAESRAAAENEKAAQVLAVIVDLLGTADPTVQPQGARTEDDRLLPEAEARAERLSGQPEVQAKLRQSLGRIYLERGQAARALPLLEAALESEIRRLPADDPILVSLQLDRAKALHSQGERSRAREELQQLKGRLEATGAASSMLYAELLVVLAGQQSGREAEDLLEQALVILRAQPQEHPQEAGNVLNVLATHRQLSGDRASAQALFAESIRLQEPSLGADHPEVLKSRCALGTVLPEAPARLEAARDCVARVLRVFGENNVFAASQLGWLAKAEAELGNWTVATATYGRSFEVWSRVHGAGHPNVLAARRFYAWSLERSGDTAAALATYDLLEAELKAPGLDPRTVAYHRAERAAALLRAGRTEDAEEVAEEVAELLAGAQVKALRAGALAVLTRALCRLARGDAAAAVRLLEPAQTDGTGFFPEALEPALLQAALGRALVASGERERARTLLSEAVTRLAASWLTFPADLEEAQRALAGLEERRASAAP